MKKIAVLLLIMIIIAGALLSACGDAGAEDGKEPISDNSEKEYISNLVHEFGTRLQKVSLQAPKEVLESNVRENYADYVSEELLDKWIKDPLEAPGRLTSSPWPDRIEIESIDKISEREYEVKGSIIEVTSTDIEKGTFSAKRPVVIKVVKENDLWLIDEVHMDGYESDKALEYENTEFGFRFYLPDSWKGYSVISEEWTGRIMDGKGEGESTVTGPLLSIRHPLWAKENPRQDIPIMIFTVDQWDTIQQERLHIGAAPIKPRELGRNDSYVFALPARYNFAFQLGYEEVEDIINNHPLKPM